MDDIQRKCPFPKVAEALQPYTKTRQKAQDIRRGLQASLPASPLDPTQPSHLDVTQPGGFYGVRKAYLRALQAHRAAQEKYDTLKAELDNISQNDLGTGTQTDAESLNEAYVPLVRQREKKRQLDVVDRTLYTISTTGGDIVSQSLDKVVKRDVGELPAPPSSAGFADRELGSDTEFDVMRIKKAILAAKQEIEEYQTASTQANGVADGEVDPVADLKALQKTHSELTAWMEKQLAMISDIDSPKDGGSSIHSATDQASSDGLSFSITDVESLYDQYLDSRQRLLEIISTQEQDVSDSRSSSPDRKRRISTTTFESETSLPNTSEILLPYLSRLTLAKQTEQTLLQQSTFARRQIATAESRTQEMLARLADESHLVQPEHRKGLPQGRDWRVAAEAASGATSTTAMEKLQSGQSAVESAAQSLAGIQGMPKSIEALLD